MKNTFLFLLFTLLSYSVWAQRNPMIEDNRVEFDKTTYDAISMQIDADYKTVNDYLEDFFDDRYDVDLDKLNKNRSSIASLAEQVNMPIVSKKMFDLYTKVEEDSDKSNLNMAFVFSDSDVVTAKAHPLSYDAANALMAEFRTYFYTRYFDEKIEEVRDRLDDVRDDKKDAKKDADKARRKIEKYERKIEKYRGKIEDLRSEIGEELETAEEKAARAKKVEDEIRELERMKKKYVGK